MILVTRPSHNRAPGSETRETILIKHVSELRAKDKLDNNVTTTMLILGCKIPANSNAHCKTILGSLCLTTQIIPDGYQAVHVKNLVMLLSVQPGIYNEFIAGNFVIHGLIVNCP